MSNIRTTRIDKRNTINNYSSWVYGLYLDSKLIYVGVTSDPQQRCHSHSNKKTFDEFRLIKGFSSRDRAEQYENLCIKTFLNLINIVSLEPRRSGFHNRKPSLPEKEIKLWESSLSCDFDFSLLSNKSILRRIKWQMFNIDKTLAS